MMFLGEVMPSRCLWVTAGLQLLQIFFFFQTAATWVFAALNFRGIKLARVLLCAVRAETALSGKYYIVTALRAEKGTFLDLVKTIVMGISEPVLVSACKHRLWKQPWEQKGWIVCISIPLLIQHVHTRKLTFSWAAFPQASYFWYRDY